MVDLLVTITELEGLVNTRGCARGHGGTEDTVVGGEVNLDGWVAAAVVDGACVDLEDLGLRNVRTWQENEFEVNTCEKTERVQEEVIAKGRAGRNLS